MSNLRYLKHKILYTKLFEEVGLAHDASLNDLHVASISSFTNDAENLHSLLLLTKRLKA